MRCIGSARIAARKRPHIGREDHPIRPGPDHAVHREHARKRAAELVAELAGRRAVLDLDD